MNTKMNQVADLLDRGPPSDPEAEAAVLASVLLRPDLFADVSKAISLSDFVDPIHIAIYTAMQSLHRRGQPIEPTLLVGELRDVGRFGTDHAKVQLADLVHLFKLYPVPSNFKHYCDRLQTISRRRSAHMSGVRLLQEAQAQDSGPAVIQRAARQAVAYRARQRRKGDRL
jgi:replicative DNA helicase